MFAEYKRTSDTSDALLQDQAAVEGQGTGLQDPLLSNNHPYNSEERTFILEQRKERKYTQHRYKAYQPQNKNAKAQLQELRHLGV